MLFADFRAGQSQTGESTWDLFDDPIIKWGGVQARSSKRARHGEALASSVFPVHDMANNCQNGSSRLQFIPETKTGSTIVKGEVLREISQFKSILELLQMGFSVILVIHVVLIIFLALD
ncbi:hypothetical protein Drorol1_Dr00027279 [Drosera rotundifolia]